MVNGEKSTTTYIIFYCICYGCNSIKLISDQTGFSKPTISRHLNWLRVNKLIITSNGTKNNPLVIRFIPILLVNYINTFGINFDELWFLLNICDSFHEIKIKGSKRFKSLKQRLDLLKGKKGKQKY